MKDELTNAMDRVYALVKQGAELGQKQGRQAAETIRAVEKETRLPAGLRDAVSEARKQFDEGSDILGRVLAEHLNGVRDLQLLGADEPDEVEDVEVA